MHYRGADCLIWPYYRNGGGYAWAKIDGVSQLVSRYLCEKIYGSAPGPGWEAAHSCGKGADGCIAIDHLRWATKIANEADKLAHNTDNRGERHGNAKLSEDDVREIRKLDGTMPQKSIAERFDVTPSTIRLIVKRERWGWLR